MPYGKRQLTCILDEHGCAIKRNDVFLALAEINSAVCIGKNKVIAVLLGVISSGVKRKAVFSFNAENIVKLEKFALPLMSRRLADSDKAAAVINKLFNCRDNFLVAPIFAAALSSVCVAHIDNNIKLL